MPFIDRFYVWSDVTAEHRGELLAYDRENEGFHPNLPEAALVVQRLRELAPQKRAISVFEATIDGRRTYFQAQLRFVFPIARQADQLRRAARRRRAAPPRVLPDAGGRTS